MLTKIFQGQLETKQRSFVSKQGHRQPHIHSMARVLSPQLLNCLLWNTIGYIYCNCGNIRYYNLTLKKNVIKEIKI